MSDPAFPSKRRTSKIFDMKQMDDTDLQELFQALAPPRGHQERFRKKLEQQHKQKPQWVTWVASIAAIGIVGWLTISQIQSPELELPDAETSDYFIEQIRLEQSELMQNYGTKQPQAVQQMMSQLDKLQQKEELLRQKLYTLENYETLLPALMENLQTQLEILAQMKKELNPKNQDSYEDTIY